MLIANLPEFALKYSQYVYGLVSKTNRRQMLSDENGRIAQAKKAMQ